MSPCPNFHEVALAERLAYDIDYMLKLKGLPPTRTTLPDLVKKGFKPVALDTAPWTEKETRTLKLCLSGFAIDPYVVGEWGTSECNSPPSLVCEKQSQRS